MAHLLTTLLFVTVMAGAAINMHALFSEYRDAIMDALHGRSRRSAFTYSAMSRMVHAPRHAPRVVTRHKVVRLTRAAA